MKDIQTNDIFPKKNDVNKLNCFNLNEIYVAFGQGFFMKTIQYTNFEKIYKLTDKLTMFINKFQIHYFFRSNSELI